MELRPADSFGVVTSRLRILMIGAGNPPSTFIQRQIQSLKQHGVEVSVLPEFKSHRFLNLKLCQAGFTIHLTQSMRIAIAAADLLHYQWPGHLIAYGCLARRYKKPVVLSLRGRQINIVPYMPGESRYVRQLKTWLPRCHGYHGVSEAILDEAEPFGLVRSRAKVVRPAIDPEFFTPATSAPAPAPIQIAMVGALMWRKGYEYALMAFCRLLDRVTESRLVIVGEGEERDRIEHTAQDLGVADRVVLAGKLDPTGVREVLWRSHLFLHASLSEGIANVALEAMACGLPVVATDAGGMREAIDDGVNGFLVPLRDTEAMADRLVRLANNPELRAEMGRKARDRAVRDFDLKDQGRKFVELYQEVLSQHANRIS
jgi:colanic acid/amylovoran biosynthesis glycosyltransferase